MLLRLLPAAGAVTVVLLLSGCTGSPAATSTPSATPTAVVTPSASPTPSASAPDPSATPTPSGSTATAESSYVAFVKGFSPTLAAKSDADLLALGQEVCAGFAKGEDEAQVARTLQADDRAQGLDATGAAAILGGAVGALCPKYHDALQS